MKDRDKSEGKGKSKMAEVEDKLFLGQQRSKGTTSSRSKGEDKVYMV